MLRSGRSSTFVDAAATLQPIDAEAKGGSLDIRIFISYCHDDVRPDSERLVALVDELKGASKGLYDVLADYEHPTAGVGTSLSAYISQIETADAVLLLLGPEYKRRVSIRSDTGVYVEFKAIYDRYLQALEQRRKEPTFLLVPIAFVGERAQCCPEELEDVIGEDLSWLHVTRGKQRPYVARPLQARFRKIVRKITDRIAAIHETKTQDYLERQETLFREFLFDDTKSRWNRPENRRYVDSAFVKTATFNRIRARGTSFVVGRKGSGKSTITHVLPMLAKPFPSHFLGIDFEQLPFTSCFNILRENGGAASDLKHIHSTIQSYELLWDLFLHLFFAWEARTRFGVRTKLRKRVSDLLAEDMQGVTDEEERRTIATRVLFVFAFEQVLEFVTRLTESAARKSGISTAVGGFTSSRLRTHVFGKAGWTTLSEYLQDCVTDRRRIAVTADGFDTKAGYFISESDKPGEASAFERDVLRALCRVILDKGPVGEDNFYRAADFCVALPYDRFYGVRESDRDRYEFRHRLSDIAWTGIELSALIRKRLALWRSVPDPSGPALEERLAAVMKKGYPELPDEIAFTFGAARHRMPLFLYVLRHTFWRPRDVLYFYSCILAASEAFTKKRKVMPSEFVRQVIANGTRAIIEDEFLAEFRASFPNLREVLMRFRRGPQFLAWEEVAARVGRVSFGSDGLRECTDLESKVSLLYEIGVLGVSLGVEDVNRLSSYRHAFVFNESRLLAEKLSREDYPGLTFVLHPLFCEYLHLVTNENPELVLPLDWEYLHDDEVLRGAVPV